MTQESFTKWLGKQVERDDAVGDLVRDNARDPHFPREAEPQEVVRYVAGRSERGGLAALEAWTEWRRVGRAPESAAMDLAGPAREIAVLLEGAGVLLMEGKNPGAFGKLFFATFDLKSRLREAVMRAAVDGGDAALEELHELADALCDTGEKLRHALPQQADAE